MDERLIPVTIDLSLTEARRLYKAFGQKVGTGRTTLSDIDAAIARAISASIKRAEDFAK